MACMTNWVFVLRNILCFPIQAEALFIIYYLIKKAILLVNIRFHVRYTGPLPISLDRDFHGQHPCIDRLFFLSAELLGTVRSGCFLGSHRNCNCRPCIVLRGKIGLE